MFFLHCIIILRQMKSFLQNWGISYFIAQSINRCNIGGWQVIGFLFINEWNLDSAGETTT